MLLPFSEYDIVLKEKKEEKKYTGHFFDLDNCLFDTDHHRLRVHVKDSNGNRIQTLSNQEYNDHKLPENHSYDFSEYTNSDLFGETAKPIKRMMNKLKAVQKNGDKAEIVTARGDMDNQERFAHHMNKYGIDINKDVHVRRTGEMKGSIADNKAKIIKAQILKHGYGAVHFYDDDRRNIDKFLKLKKQMPDVEFNAHHVTHDPMTGKTEIKHTKAE